MTTAMEAEGRSWSGSGTPRGRSVLPTRCGTRAGTGRTTGRSATVAAFRAEQGRAPDVLDLGCGTGMLTLLCLGHGARPSWRWTATP